MDKKRVLWLSILLGIVLLSCSSHQAQKAQVSSPAAPMEQEKRTELKQQYGAARSEQERRRVCLAAIDANLVHAGGSVAEVNEICGKFSFDTAEQNGAKRHGVILFADQPSLPNRPNGIPEGVADVGSYLDFSYDSSGTINDYRLSNLHKGGSRRTDGRPAISVAELRSLYQRATSESERRDVALRAIDEGVIQTFGPVNVSTIDAVFGSQLAAHLPTKKESPRVATIDFSFPAPVSPNPDLKTQTAGQKGWFMAVEYDHTGNIQNYYLTNIPAPSRH